MLTDRLKLALGLIPSSEWARFERFASAFLVGDFGDLRTMACPSGDEGRDAELFSPDNDASVVLQYSLSEDWLGKIQRTVNRIKVSLPNANMLIYVSNKVIGPKADAIKSKVRRDFGLSLDVRDQSWFTDRVLGSRTRERASEELARAIVDPFLADNGVTPSTPTELSSTEAVAAVTFLGLQWQDDARDMGLTRLAFEALVRAVLANTHSNRRMPRIAIYAGVQQILPGHPETQIRPLVDASLRRLPKSVLRERNDEFYLDHEEVARVQAYKTKAAIAEAELAVSIEDILSPVLGKLGLPAVVKARLIQCVRAGGDAVLLERSQAFAMAISSGSLATLANDDHTSVLQTQISRTSLPKIKGIDWLSIVPTGR